MARYSRTRKPSSWQDNVSISTDTPVQTFAWISNAHEAILRRVKTLQLTAGILAA